MIQLLIESILFNTDARVEMDDKAYYVPVGNPTDIGFIRFLQEADVPVHDVIKEKLGRIETVIPLSPIRKRAVIAIRHPDINDIVRIYVKGAPEYIIDKCTRTHNVDGSRAHMDNEQLNYIKNDIITKQFTSQGYRAIAFAYKDLNVADFEKLKEECNNF
jgi:magnesium-transporting ATPase (P-type)